MKKKPMTSAERQKKYMLKPENKEKHQIRMRIYNDKMKRARQIAKESGAW